MNRICPAPHDAKVEVRWDLSGIQLRQDDDEDDDEEEKRDRDDSEDWDEEDEEDEEDSGYSV